MEVRRILGPWALSRTVRRTRCRGPNRHSGRRWRYLRLGPLLLSVEIPDEVQIRERFLLPHNGIAVVIHESTIVGHQVQIYPGITIGRAGLYHLWAETSRAGGVVVGDKFVIGSGAKVLFTVPPREVGAGMPAVKVGMNSALVAD